MTSGLSFHHPQRARSRRARGLSLVELMISITLGMLIIAALALLLSNSSRSRGEMERVSQRIDNGRYAIELMTGEIQNAGYFAEFDPRQLNLPATKPDPCLTSAAELAAALRLHVQGYNDVAGGVLSCLADVRPGTDVIVVRRASGCIAGASGCAALGSGDFAFQASSCNSGSELGSSSVSAYYALTTSPAALTRTRKDCATPADIRRYLIRIYFVAANDKAGDGIPTLKRAELAAGAWRTASLVQGIENMQIEYGLDTLPDGSAEVYTPAPDSYLACTDSSSPSCVQHWASVVTARITLLSRNTEPSPGFADSKVYTLGRNADGADGSSGTGKTLGPFNDAFKRNVFQTVIRFQNASGRRAP